MSFARRRSAGEIFFQDSKRPRLDIEKTDDDCRAQNGKDIIRNHHPLEQLRYHEAEYGIIEKITLTNFMCHSKLEVDFGPNINFVNGRNGSGKSAILTGLVVCLGGRASTTNRGTTLKDFIQNGESSFTVEVRLRNKGPEAYKPDEYGSTICVEKKVTREGANILRIRGEDGRLVSNKKEELLSILDQFNIQIDNPISVLTQNTSRNFLSSKKAEDLYAFFMKATLLDQMRSFNVETGEKLQISEDILSRKRETIPQLKREVEDWKQQWRLHRGLKKQKEKVQRLKAEYVWALVLEKEDEARSIFEVYERETEASKKIKERILTTKERICAKSEQHANISKSLRAAAKDLQILETEKKEITADLIETKALMRNTILENRKHEREVAFAKEDVESLKRKIADLCGSNHHNSGVEYKKRRQEIQDKEAERNKLTKDLNNSVVERTRISESIRVARDKLDLAKLEEKSTLSQISSADSKLKQFESCRENYSQRFGFYIPDLLQQIDRAHKTGRFREKPIGPIGMHITLKDPKWSLAVESSLGGLLEAFCTDNHYDERILRELINVTMRNSRKPSIIVSKFQSSVYNVREHAVEFPPFSTILDMVTVSNPAVANCLIDQRSIESILLIENKEEARQIMTRRTPRHCIQAYTIEGDQVYPAPAFRYYTNHKKTVQYLQNSVETKVDEVKKKLSELHTALKGNKLLVEETQLALRRLQSDLRKVDKQEKMTSISIGVLNVELSQLLNFVEPEPVDMTTLEEEVSLLEENIPKLGTLLEQTSKEIQEANEKQKKLRSDLLELENKITDHHENVEPLEEQVVTLLELLKNLNREYQCFETKLNDHQRKVQLLKRSWDEARIQAKEMEEKCLAICDRVATQRTSENLNLEIQKIESSLHLIESQPTNVEDVSERFLETKRRYEIVKSDIEECEVIVRKITEGVKNRQMRYVNFRSTLALRIKYSFNAHLHSRNFKGAIQFDHEKGRLELMVQANPFSKRICKDIRSLSGGERSFSTICLILSLWENMESPFRFLDEYDVFMDMVNRRKSMDMMIREATNKCKNQFIFLTPLNLSRIPQSERILIFRMPDPNRPHDQLAVVEEEEEEEEI